MKTTDNVLNRILSIVLLSSVLMAPAAGKINGRSSVAETGQPLLGTYIFIDCTGFYSFTEEGVYKVTDNLHVDSDPHKEIFFSKDKSTYKKFIFVR